MHLICLEKTTKKQNKTKQNNQTKQQTNKKTTTLTLNEVNIITPNCHCH